MRDRRSAYGDDERRSSEALVRPAQPRVRSSTSAGGSLYLAVVVPPSAEGRQGSFRVDVYGTTVASLAAAPTRTAVLAHQPTVSGSFYRGEVVYVRLVDGEWRISKFFSLNTATIAPGALWLRPFTLFSGGTPDQAAVSGRLPALYLQDTAFDYAEVVALLDPSATVLEVLGSYGSTHVVSALFDPSNMVPLKPEAAQAANLCALIPGQANHLSGDASASIGVWLTPAFGGAFTSNQPGGSGTISRSPSPTSNFPGIGGVSYFATRIESGASVSYFGGYTYAVTFYARPGSGSGEAPWSVSYHTPARRPTSVVTTGAITKLLLAAGYVAARFEINGNHAAPFNDAHHLDMIGAKYIGPDLVWRKALDNVLFLEQAAHAWSSGFVPPHVLS